MKDIDDAFSRTPRGFEACLCTISDERGLPFSRTPRGFEAVLTLSLLLRC